MAAIATSKRRIKESAGDRIFLGFIYVILTLLVIIVLYPLIYIISSSISSPAAVTSGRVWLWPVDLSFRGFEELFRRGEVITGYLNSIFYTTAGTLISVTLTIMIAYPLSRRSFFGRNALMMFITFTMIFSGGLIPTYMVVKGLDLIDTRWALLIPNAIWVWQVIIARSFFQTSIPEELLEASEIDGCSDLRFIWSVVLPLSKPIIAVLVLMYAVGQWNAYFDALIYLKSADLFPLQLILRSIIIQNNSGSNMDAIAMVEKQQLAELLKYSLIVVATLPVLIIYPFVQRYFVQGMLVGSVKG
ncbi:carbohydrate ABC transporter permease [Paenibacillus barengoltzii]|jgi:putative aldouronate transport system permease protein|uniref:Carbohydrate ABC transporter membrane protein 2, CUT1 family (TC 3.A.1.1.-) n=1 Tax=Paenibacillus barengoltzii J12 TaxID=935846 RepID=A0ABY1LUZ2_9BACL|nr:carbohydrate ABC transporter permease [Paenibacillus barengoltzii]SMF09728.1 carbohydrate ABC transporter membrane protein 2, CUT1 family (TC 3.A.1.1.-) [Paenibacillus barengoltzii J12]